MELGDILKMVDEDEGDVDVWRRSKPTWAATNARKPDTIKTAAISKSASGVLQPDVRRKRKIRETSSLAIVTCREECLPWPGCGEREL